MIGAFLHGEKKAATSEGVSRGVQNLQFDGAEGVGFVRFKRTVSNRRFRQRQSVATARGLCEGLQKVVIWMQVPVNLVVISEFRDETAVVKMSVGVDQRNDLPPGQTEFMCCFSVFWACGPVGPGASIPVDPFDDALRFVAAVDDDGVAARPVGDHRTSHLERTDKEMLDPWFVQSHDAATPVSFMRLSHQRWSRSTNRWSRNPPGRPRATQTGGSPREV